MRIVNFVNKVFRINLLGVILNVWVVVEVCCLSGCFYGKIKLFFNVLEVLIFFEIRD